MVAFAADVRTCQKHGVPKRAWRNGRERPPRWSCPACHAERVQRSRRQMRAQEARGRIAAILRGRLRADQLAEQALSLLRAAGGPARLVELAGPAAVARLALVVCEAVAQEKEWIREQSRKAELAAGDPAVVHGAEQILRALPAHELAGVVTRLARLLPEPPEERTARLVKQVEAIEAVTDEDQRIKAALRQTCGNRAAAAKLLGIARSSVVSWIQRHGS